MTTYLRKRTVSCDLFHYVSIISIAGFHTVGTWVHESVYCGINNTRPIYSERAHRALQNPKVEQDTAIQKLQNLLTSVWIAGQVSSNPYIYG